MGLKNAPGEVQRFMEDYLRNLVMEDCLRNFRDDFCAPYLDDIIIYLRSFEEHVEHVQQVLRRLRENGIKLRAKKCNLLIVSKRGVLSRKDCIRGGLSNIPRKH